MPVPQDLELEMLTRCQVKAGKHTRSSAITAVEPAWNQTLPSACERQLCSLVYLRGPWKRNQDISRTHELALWSPFSMVGYSAQP